MTIQCTGSSKGQKLYTVAEGGRDLFTGSLDEVKRFLLVRENKVRERERRSAEVLATFQQAG